MNSNDVNNITIAIEKCYEAMGALELVVSTDERVEAAADTAYLNLSNTVELLQEERDRGTTVAGMYDAFGMMNDVFKAWAKIGS